MVEHLFQVVADVELIKKALIDIKGMGAVAREPEQGVGVIRNNEVIAGIAGALVAVKSAFEQMGMAAEIGQYRLQVRSPDLVEQGFVELKGIGLGAFSQEREAFQMLMVLAVVVEGLHAFPVHAVEAAHVEHMGV